MQALVNDKPCIELLGETKINLELCGVKTWGVPVAMKRQSKQNKAASAKTVRECSAKIQSGRARPSCAVEATRALEELKAAARRNTDTAEVASAVETAAAAGEAARRNADIEAAAAVKAATAAVEEAEAASEVARLKTAR